MLMYFLRKLSFACGGQPVGASSGHDSNVLSAILWAPKINRNGSDPKIKRHGSYRIWFPKGSRQKNRFPSEFHLRFFWSHLLAGRAEVGRRHFNPVVGRLSGVTVLEPKGTEFSEPTLVLQLWILPKGALTPLHSLGRSKVIISLLELDPGQGLPTRRPAHRVHVPVFWDVLIGVILQLWFYQCFSWSCFSEWCVQPLESWSALEPTPSGHVPGRRMRLRAIEIWCSVGFRWFSVLEERIPCAEESCPSIFEVWRTSKNFRLGIMELQNIKWEASKSETIK